MVVAQIYIVRSLTGIAEVMRYAQRKALQVPVLQLNKYNEQGKEGNQADGDQEDTILQRLQTKVHAHESKV